MLLQLLAIKDVLAVYTGTQAAFEKYQQKFADPEKRKAHEKKGMEAWMKWAKAHDKSLIDGGAPLGKTKRISSGGIADIRNNLTAYTLVDAESHEAAAKMFVDHPHFTIFPGDSVEVMECLPMPRIE